MKAPLTAFATLLVVLTASGTMLLNDNFDYPDGVLTAVSAGLWSAHSGSGAVTLTNGAIRLSAALGEDVSAPLQDGPYYGTNGPVTALYASFKMRVAARPTGQGSFFAHFRDAGNGFRSRVFAVTNGAAPGMFRLGLGSGSAMGMNLTPDLSTGVIYTVVTRLTIASGAGALWINPAAETDPGIEVAGEGLVPIHTYAFRQNAGIGTLWIDELRVGTAFTDVAGSSLPPSISRIAAQDIGANVTTAPLPFTVSDPDTPLAQLRVTVASSNPVLMPQASMVLGGGGTQRTLTLTPAAGQQGTVRIEITVSDGTSSASTAFTVAVGLPSLSAVPPQQTAANTALGNIPVTVGDRETPPENLMLSGSASNFELVPHSGITFSGTGTRRFMRIQPAPYRTGVTTVTVTVSDWAATASQSFVLTVYPRLGLLCQDDFNRADGPATNGSIWSTHSGMTGETQLQGGELRLSSALGEDISATIPYAPMTEASGTILYASFTARFLETPSAAGTYFAHFKDNTTSFRGRMFAVEGSTNTGTFRLGVMNGSGTPGTNALHPQLLTTGSRYTLVLRYNVGTGMTRLWINPESEEDWGVNATDNPATSSIYGFAFRQAPGMGTVLVDNFRLGTEFSDVVKTGPKLRIRPAEGCLELSWPLTAQDYSIQEASALHPDQWEDHNEPITPVDGFHVMPMPWSGEIRFFRLIKR